MFQLYLLAQLPYLWSEQMVETRAKADVPACGLFRYLVVVELKLALSWFAECFE